MKSFPFIFLAIGSVASAAHLASSWKSNFDGSWSDPDRWNTSGYYTYPNNGTNTFDVTVGLPGNPAYAISIDSPVTIDNLTLSSNATIHQGAAVTILNTFSLASGSYALSGGSTLTTGALNLTGGTLKLALGTLAPTNITLNGGIIDGGSIETSGTGQFHITSASNNILQGTAILGPLLLDAPNARLRLRNDASFAHSDASLTGNGAILSYEGTEADHLAWLSGGSINLDASGAAISLDGSAPVLTIAAGSTVRGRGAIHHSQLISVTGTSQLVNEGLVSADLAGQNLIVTPHVVTNHATLQAVNGASLFINSASFTNLPGATLSATGASTLALQKTWHNLGNLILQGNSTLSLEGNFTTADLGLAGWTRTGCSVKIGGSLDNTNSTLPLTTISGPMILNGGVIKGGTLTQSGAKLLFSGVSSSALDAVTIADSLILDAPNSRLRLRNDTTFASATLAGFGSILAYEGLATHHAATLQDAAIHLDYGGIVSLEGSSPVLNIGTTGLIRGKGSVSHSQLLSLDGLAQLNNQGLVSADLSGQALTLTPHLVTNAGTFRAINGAVLNLNSASFTNLPGGTLSATGGSTLNLQKTWHNLGNLILQDTSTISFEGAFATADLGIPGWSRTGGTLKLAGNLDNTGATLALDATTGPIALSGGTIKGGSVTQHGAGKLTFQPGTNNVLDAVALTGGLSLDPSNSRVSFRNDATAAASIGITGSSSIVGFEGTAVDSTATLADTTFAMDGSGATLSLDGISPMLSIAPTSIVRGRGNIATGQLVAVTGTAKLFNNGLISADLAGQSLNLNIFTLVNTGILEAKNDATLSLSPLHANQAAGTFRLGGGAFQITSSVAGADVSIGNGGFLQGFGEVRLYNPTSDTFALAGTIDPSSGSGGLVIKGDLVPAVSATFVFDLAGTTQATAYDFISEAGSTALAFAGSTLKITLATEFTPANADIFTVLSSNQPITGSFGNVPSGGRLATADGRGSFLVSYSGTSLILSNFEAAPSIAYQAWISAYFPDITDPQIIGQSADPDHDGTPNLLEFAMKGDPSSGSSRGLSHCGFKDIDPAPGLEFAYTIAFRQNAIFTQQADGSQRNLTPVDDLTCTIQGSLDLTTYTEPLLHTAPSFTPPSGTNLPDLTNTGWEYQTFYRNPAFTSPRLFLRAKIGSQL